MMLPGFPYRAGGHEKFKPRSNGWKGNEAADDWSDVVLLVQRFETAILEVNRAETGDLQALAQRLIEVVSCEAFRPYLETIHSAQVVGDILEVEFSAAGYPDRYVSHVCVHGSGARYRVRRISEPKRVITSRCRWAEASRGTVCKGDAIDDRGEVRCRVTVAVQHRVGANLEDYRGGPLHDIDHDVTRLARKVALMSGKN